MVIAEILMAESLVVVTTTAKRNENEHYEFNKFLYSLQKHPYSLPFGELR